MQSHRRHGLKLALSKAWTVWVIGAALLATSNVQALEPPTGPVVLTIDGAITQTNRGQQA
eukprot:gene19352-24502_t